MSQQVAKLENKDIFHFQGSMVENMQMAEMLANSTLVPTDYKNAPGNVIVAVQMGQEVGLKPMQALQNIAVINGRPCIWGDALIGLVRNSSACEYVKESFDHETMTATCIAKRFGEEEHKAVFSQEDAIRAGLWQEKANVYSNKYKKEIPNTSPWYKYPKRMLQMRARGFCLRDLFADVLKGLNVAEEVEDYELKQVNEAPAQTAKAKKFNDLVNDAPDVTEYETSQADVQRPSEFDLEGAYKAIGEATDMEALTSLASTFANAPEESRPALRKAWGNKRNSLEGA